MFTHWDSFYLLIGGAAGALIGLLFVVATLTGGFGREKAMRGAQIYMTPTVFHFTVILVVSALTGVPDLGATPTSAGLGAIGMLGLLYGLGVSRRLLRRDTPEPPHWTDFWCYGLAPAGIYIAMVATAAMFKTGASWAPDALGAVLIALLVLAIRNAWDLVTWLAPAAAERRQP
jgi:hypothetical protein